MITAMFFAAAMDILANCRAMLPVEPTVMKGEIVLRNRRGIPSGEYDYTLKSDRTSVPAKISLEFFEHDTTNVVERHEILRPGPVPKGRVLKTDVTWLDLTLDFLWWPKAEFDAEREGETVHGQKCDVILVSNGERQVRAWCDKKTGCLMQAEELHDGKARRRLWGTRIKKFDGRWFPNVLEVETIGSGHRTKIIVDELKVGK
ncbi:MAG: outer membrane lipoprotein-sorting protein [Kiritimatiellae bacterium]|nr:outer membrane lipoprotein-sorting protein [Kiritimatiellia bacterium]